MSDSKLHFRIQDANLCGKGTNAYSTYTEEGVTCKLCLRKMPALKAEQARIAAYNNNHIAIVTFKIPLSQWNRFVAYVNRRMAINEIIGGLAGEIVQVFKCIGEGKVEIKEK